MHSDGHACATCHAAGPTLVFWNRLRVCSECLNRTLPGLADDAAQHAVFEENIDVGARGVVVAALRRTRLAIVVLLPIMVVGSIIDRPGQPRLLLLAAIALAPLPMLALGMLAQVPWMLLQRQRYPIRVTVRDGWVSCASPWDSWSAPLEDVRIAERHFRSWSLQDPHVPVGLLAIELQVGVDRPRRRIVGVTAESRQRWIAIASLQNPSDARQRI